MFVKNMKIVIYLFCLSSLMLFIIGSSNSLMTLSKFSTIFFICVFSVGENLISFLSSHYALFSNIKLLFKAALSSLLSRRFL